MKRAMLATGLMILMMNTVLFATTCREYEEAYAIAQHKMNELGGKSTNRESYDLVNALIDTATGYLAYCKELIALGEQYQIQQVIKRADKKRRKYFIGAIREYHAIYGIRPNVTEIYQDGSKKSEGDGKTPSKERSEPQSPPRFPPVQQPMMPPVQH